MNTVIQDQKRILICKRASSIGIQLEVKNSSLGKTKQFFLKILSHLEKEFNSLILDFHLTKVMELLHNLILQILKCKMKADLIFWILNLNWKHKKQLNLSKKWGTIQSKNQILLHLLKLKELQATSIYLLISTNNHLTNQTLETTFKIWNQMKLRLLLNSNNLLSNKKKNKKNYLISIFSPFLRKLQKKANKLLLASSKQKK